MRLAANLTLLFPELPMLDRVQAARQAGYDGVEVLFPYAQSVADWRAALGATPLALINTPAGDWATGERGFAALAGQEARFRADFAQALHYARDLGAQNLHVMAGNAVGAQAAACFATNLGWAADVARDQAPALTLTIEPLNARDMPGYFLADYDQAARLLTDLARPNLGLQFDIWHAARIHGDALAQWMRHAAHVRHVQIAGFPARGAPDHAATTLAQIAIAGGYSGWFAAEYLPDGCDSGWIARLRADSAKVT